MIFKISKKLEGAMARAGEVQTAHGTIKTPAFVVVGTKAAVKALSPEQMAGLGVPVVLANTYHLYLQPGDEIVAKGGGFGPFMGWHGPTMTDSGGFQAFSLGAAFGSSVSKIATDPDIAAAHVENEHTRLANVTDDGVEFRSYRDGSSHFFTPERSMEIQWNLGADIIFAFDECTSPLATDAYQRVALNRTFEWAKRCIARHEELDTERKQALFGVVQGGRVRELREEAARMIGSLPFDGFGIGGSFTKADIGTAVAWVNAILPEEKPRHLLGIGEPEDLFAAVESGCDLFDCIAPTRMARHGTLHSKQGRINIKNAQYVEDFRSIDERCTCYTCTHHSRAYLCHLYRSNEMLAATLGSIHNVHFILRLVETMRETILDETFFEFKREFLKEYYGRD